MKKYLHLLVIIMLFSACAPRRGVVSNREARQNNKRVKEENSASVAAYTPLTSVQYIARYKDIAIKEMNLYGIPASITLAQGLFESGSGNGELARVANNHFGVKCTADWKGRRYYRDDDNANDCFRVYDSAEESFRDHSLFLKRRNYAPLYNLDITDYKGWARGLKKAGYATNPNYPSLLIGIIEKYKLNQYDAPGDIVVKKTDTVATKADRDIIAAPQDSAIKAAAVPANIYTVKQGDTLYNISKRFGLTVDELKALNNMTANNIRIGQKLVVAKQ